MVSAGHSGSLEGLPDGCLEVLFTTESGRMLLWTAVGMLVVGVLAIRRLSRLRT